MDTTAAPAAVANRPSLDDELRRLFAKDPELCQDPYPLYARLRDESPVHCHEGFVIASQHQYAKAVFRDHRSFEATPNRSGSIVQLPERLSLLSEADLALLEEYYAFEGLQMVHRNGESHRRIRSAGQRAFTPKRVADLAAAIARIADDLLSERATQAGTCDLAELCHLLPLLVISEMMDVPPEDAHLVKAWSEAKFALSVIPMTPELVRDAYRMMNEFREYVADLVDRHRRAERRSMLVADLLDASSGDQLSEDELAAMYRLLLFGAHETTANMLGNGIASLLTYVDQWELLRSDPSLVPSAVEEFLRFEASSQFFPKVAAADVELGGVEIAAGTTVLAAICAANRDPSAFDDPDAFDIRRRPNDHLTFGGGIHFCIGAPVARLEGRILLGTLLRRFPDLELAVDPGELYWRPAYINRSLARIPVALGADRG